MIGTLHLVKKVIESSSSSEEQESSSDEDLLLINIKKNYSKKHVKIENYVLSVVPRYCDMDFKSHFRLTRTVVEMVLEDLQLQSIKLNISKQSVSPQHAFLLTLWVLANQESFRGIADRFGLSRGHAHTIFIKTVKGMYAAQDRYIIWPQNAVSLRRKILDFNNLRGNSSFPNVVGCVDGSHILINGPRGDDSYYNRKGSHSMLIQDEVLAISEKVVIRLEDLITWIIVETEWSWGRLAKCEEDLKDVSVEADQLACPRKPAGNSFTLSEIIMDFSDVEQEREKFEESSNSGPHVIILSFPKYCRYRAMMRRLEGVENLYLKYKIVNALGGFYVQHPNTRVLFCRDTFDYPELEGHELLCNHLAPKLKGRPRGKRKKRSISPGSESNESESSITNHFNRSNEKPNGVCSNSSSSVATRRSTRCHENNENKQFMKILAAFMKAKHLPMGRIPSLGYKELNLHEFYTRVQKLGGYECVTMNRLWKSIFDDMTGHLNSTSAATIIRRHYERFLLAYERHEKGEEDKPLPISERRRLKNKQAAPPGNGSSESESGTDTPSTSRSSSSPPTGTENKEFVSSGKTSSLRSIRVKPERQKDKLIDKPGTEDQIKPELSNATNQTIPVPTIKNEPEDFKPVIEVAADKNDGYVEEKPDIKVEVKIETNVEDEVHLEEEEEVQETQEINIKEEEKPKSEPDEIKPSVPEGTKTEGSIPAEPITNAVAPVVTTIIPEKIMSPMEGKENIPVIKTGDIATITASPKVTNVPSSNNSPDITPAVSEAYKDADDSTIHDVKRIKLDILKEGGLEVTAVRSGSTPTSIKEFRPSVIQPPPNNNNNTSNFAKPVMAPPLLSNVLPKRNPATSLPPSINITQVKTAPTTPVKQAKPDNYQFLNGTTPPKVVQSRSIYSYSEKTVYGNPKDFLQPSSVVPHAPKSLVSNARSGGSDPVDLSLTSPQKPMIEIMPVPQSFASNAQMSYNRASVSKNLYKTTPPLLDGRKLGPNLEITLVGPKPHQHASSVARHPTSSHKRSGAETYAQKIAKLKSEEISSRHSRYTNIPPMHKSSSVDIPVPSPFKSSAGIAKPDVRQPLPQAMPPYLSARFAPPTDNANGLNHFLPFMDSLYYQAALQNVYSNLSSMPPMLPLPTPEQLKFYADLMAHGRFNMPFSHPADGHPSMNSGGKKP